MAAFVGKDPDDLLPILLRLQRRIEGVKREIDRGGGNGKLLCPKCRAPLCGWGDAFYDPSHAIWSPYFFCCHICGERVDKQIFQNWIQSEFRIKIEMGLRPRRENIMRRCRICKQEKADEDFDSWGNKKKSTCRECGGQRKAFAAPSGGQQDLAGDFGKMFAAIKKEGERDGAQKVAQDIIEFLKKKYIPQD